MSKEAKSIRNCRACYSSYNKSTGYWCELPQLEVNDEDELEIVEPVGFCEFCDKNNKTWYIPDVECRTGKENCNCIMCRRKLVEENNMKPKHNLGDTVKVHSEYHNKTVLAEVLAVAEKDEQTVYTSYGISPYNLHSTKMEVFEFTNSDIVE